MKHCAMKRKVAEWNERLWGSKEGRDGCINDVSRYDKDTET